METKETMEAPLVINLLIHHVFKLHGLPTPIVLDMDASFISYFGGMYLRS